MVSKLHSAISSERRLMAAHEWYALFSQAAVAHERIGLNTKMGLKARETAAFWLRRIKELEAQEQMRHEDKEEQNEH